MKFPASARYAAAALFLSVGAGCSAPGSSGPGGIARLASAGRSAIERSLLARHSVASGKIQHVVFLIQENRSFNNLFMGYPGATTQKYGYTRAGVKIKLHPQTLATTWDIDHSANAFFTDYDNGRLDGWNQQSHGGGAPQNFPFAYVPKKEIKPYWALAQQYVLADDMFTSNIDGSFIDHQFSIAASANGADNFPSSAWGCPGGPSDVIGTWNPDRTYGPNIPMCWDIPTIGDEADAAGVTWHFYAGAVNGDGGIWSAYQNINHIYNGPDWAADVVNPPSQFITDVANGKLSNITWVTPTGRNSDHAGSNSTSGPAWVAALVNAVGQSQFWDSTAIFIVWDDWGGWFDPVAPVYEDYAGLGFRVPLLIVSPYAKQGYVTHVQYENASVLRFMEDTFGLGQLAASDTRAADPAGDAFDFTQSPRPFQKVKGALPREFLVEQERHGGPGGVPKNFIGGD